MPLFQPFRPFRYATDDSGRVLAPPYDVLSEADVRQLQLRSEHNIVHIDVPRGGPDRYQRAAETLRCWIDQGVLVQDREPSFTLYRMNFDDEAGRRRQVVGVLGALEVVDEGAGGVLPHERTTPKASTDRLDLTRATRANLSPVWGLSTSAGLTSLLAGPGEQVGVLEEDGVEHVVERVTDRERISEIGRAMGSGDVLIADGHHRYGVARIYRDEIRASTGRYDTPAELTLTFVGELVADQLSVAAIHRLYSGIDRDSLRTALAQHFKLAEISRPTPETLLEMEREGFLVLVDPNASWSLTPLPGSFAGLRELDGIWLEHALADVSPGIAYQHGLSETLAAVESGQAAAAVLVRPVSVTEIERTAREGVLMPPKSTFFTPKLKTGWVIRPLSPVDRSQFDRP